MKKSIIIAIVYVLLTNITQAQEQKSKWFGQTSSYLAIMQLIPNSGTSATILMAGGEKPIYNFSTKTSINVWHFEYIDNAVGYIYGGPSILINFEKGFLDIGVAGGVTSQNFKPIYSFLMVGQYAKVSYFFNSEHNAWPNWHRAWICYDATKNIGIMAGSQGFYGPGIGTKLSYKKIQLQSMYHIGVNKKYLGSINNTSGISLMFSVGI